MQLQDLVTNTCYQQVLRRGMQVTSALGHLAPFVLLSPELAGTP